MVTSNQINKTGLHIPSTSKHYGTYLKKFAEFLNVNYNPERPLPKSVYTDTNIAAWFEDLYKDNYKPHIIKSAKAAIHSEFLIHGLKKIHEASHEWPLTCIQLQKITTMGKMNPYFVSPASIYSPEAIQYILELACTNIEMVQDKAFVLLTIYTGMRLKNVYEIYSKDITFVPFDVTTNNPRHYSMMNITSKNDRSGTGPNENRLYLLPCICLQLLTGRERNDFIRKLISNNLCNCVRPCPFNAVRTYINLCPDPTGSQRVLERQLDPTLSNVKLMRTKQLLGSEPKFLLTPMGESTIRKIPDRINGYLPHNLQQEKLTGHSGRTSLITHALNEGVPDTIVAKTSKHKDVNQLKRYHQSNVSSLLAPSLALVSNNLNKTSSDHGREALDISNTIHTNDSFADNLKSAIKSNKRKCDTSESEDITSSDDENITTTKKTEKSKKHTKSKTKNVIHFHF
mmetsp:Transcript_17828/g.16094  ORF Transcript_17828/g.16094 Transcript_17828/m.16094 type:complete len:456 (-) Transcript_17828:10-1377(-)